MAAGPDHAFSDTARLFSMLASAVPVGLAFVDTEMRYRLVNEAFSGFVNRMPGQMIGRPLAEWMPALWPQIEPIVRRALLKGEGTYDHELAQPLPNGEP